MQIHSFYSIVYRHFHPLFSLFLLPILSIPTIILGKLLITRVIGLVFAKIGIIETAFFVKIGTLETVFFAKIGT